ncbi:MAG: RIP metalloprotease RseP [Pseudomonadota bacterium]
MTFLTNTIWGIFGLIVTISILVAIHEYGHYAVARLCGIKVLRFSIGFGKPIWTKRAGPDQTEYCISALPLGGYVKMLDDREGDVAPEDKGRTFNAQPVWQRIAVLLAGPAANFLLAIAAYWLLFVYGTTTVRPVVGIVTPESPAAMAGLRYGDVIAAVGEREVESWNGRGLQAIVDEMVDDARIPLTLERASGERVNVELVVDADTARLSEPGRIFEGLGFKPWSARAIVGRFQEGSVGRMAGLEISDRVVAVDGTPVSTFNDMREIVVERPGERLAFDILRGTQPLTIAVDVASADNNGTPIGLIGVYPADERPANLYARKQLGLGVALPEAFTRTVEQIGFTFEMFGRMATGSVSTKNISGPISIGQFAGQSLERGFDWFLDFLAMVSISLGALNLLPIPMLDGGQVVYQLIEGTTGRPMAERWQIIGQQIGIVVLLGVMSLAFYNDIARLVGDLLT